MPSSFQNNDRYPRIPYTCYITTLLILGESIERLIYLYSVEEDRYTIEIDNEDESKVVYLNILFLISLLILSQANYFLSKYRFLKKDFYNNYESDSFISKEFLLHLAPALASCFFIYMYSFTQLINRVDVLTFKHWFDTQDEELETLLRFVISSQLSSMFIPFMFSIEWNIYNIRYVSEIDARSGLTVDQNLFISGLMFIIEAYLIVSALYAVCLLHLGGIMHHPFAASAIHYAEIENYFLAATNESLSFIETRPTALIIRGANDYNTAMSFFHNIELLKNLTVAFNLKIAVAKHASDICSLLSKVGPVHTLILNAHSDESVMQFSHSHDGKIFDFPCDGNVTKLVENTIFLDGCDTASGSFFQNVFKQFSNRTVCGSQTEIRNEGIKYSSENNRFSFFPHIERTNGIEEDRILCLNNS